MVPHGVAPDCLYPVEPALRTLDRQLFGFQPEDVVLLNLGALTPNKGVDLLLRAYASLKPAYPQLKLLIKDQSNLYPRSLQDVLGEKEEMGQPLRLSEDHGRDVIPLSENLDLEGLRALYNACDAYVSPYRAEGFNLPPLEAAAACRSWSPKAERKGMTSPPQLGLRITSQASLQGPFRLGTDLWNVLATG